MHIDRSLAPGIRFIAAALVAAAASTISAAELPRFSSNPVWQQAVDTAALHPQSASMIQTWSALGGFGNGRMQIDFGMFVNRAAVDSATRTISGYPYDDYYSPDCDPIGSSMPVPVGARIEHNSGLSCDNEGEDCHLLVVRGNTLYEAYHVNADSAATLEAQCLVRWQLDAQYSPRLRGEHCTSADAAGLPIAPLLLNSDEVAAALPIPGSTLEHALRFILPNARMANDPALGGVGGRLYVRPATHAGSPSGPSGSVPYGVRLRLRADFPMAGYNAAAQVILRTLQRYGMLLADGGTIALSGESDALNANTWASLGIGARVFDTTPGAQVVRAQDFEVVDTGARIAETFNCVREEPLPAPLFADGFA
jgi:serine/threonine-protein kinase